MLCPKCKQDLQPSGELTIGDDRYTVYQCDDCTRQVLFDGERFDVALTFAVDADGNLVDADRLDALRGGPFDFGDN